MNVPKNLDKLALAASQKLKEKVYWTNQLSGEVVSSHFPFDYTHTGVEGEEREEKALKEMNFRLDDPLYTRMMEIGSDSAFTLHLILTAGLAALLYKYTDQDDIILGTPIYKQAKEGEFINTILPLRQRLHENITFRDLLLKVKESMAEAVEHQSYPIELLADRLKLSGSNAIQSGGLFDTAILLRNIQDKTYLQNTRRVMTYSFLETGQDLELEVEYNPRLYRQSTVQRLVRHFENLMRNALVNLDLNIPHIRILDQEEKKNLLETFNLTGVGYPADKTLQQLFTEQVEQTPDQIALIGPHELCFEGPGGLAPLSSRSEGTRELPPLSSRSEGTRGLAPLSLLMSITYKELNENANQLAYSLEEKGVRPDTIVGIIMERSIDIIMGILGILKAGGAYLPIDPDYPPERINYMTADSNTKFLVTTLGLTEKIKKLLIVNCQLLIVNEEPPGCPGFNNPPKEANSVNNYQFTINNLQLEWNNLAYIIYTSGTTGKPKGVMIEQKSVVRLFFTDTPRFDFHSSDTWTMFHSPCFDFSVWEMYGALLYGGKLVIISKQTARDPGAFLEMLKAYQVTVLNQTPSAFYSLIHEELISSNKELNLKYVIFGGEALKPAKLNEWYHKYPCTKLVNMFGITETTVHVTYKEITREDIQSGISNIGVPLPTLSTMVVDRHMNLLPVGICGELYVGGQGTARGYINQPELTEERFKRAGIRHLSLVIGSSDKFLPNDQCPMTNDRFYKSGDLVRVSDGGDLEYHGRIDHQVQVRGFRVELGEIEHRLLRHQDIKEVVVLPVDQEDGLLLYAYLVPSSPRFLSVPQLKEFLVGQLPEYMIPHYFVTVEQIPLTPNGKVDRKALLERGTVLAEEYIPPRNQTEEKLAALWTEILKKEKIGIKENFFDIGGDSIKAIRLANLVNGEFDINLRVVDLYTHTTIDLLAEKVTDDMQIVSRKETDQTAAEIKALKDRITRENDLGEEIEDIYPLSDIEKGIVFYYLKHLGTGLYHDQFVYPIKYRKFEIERLKRAMTLMVQKHSILRTGFNLEDYEQPLQLVYKKPVLDLKYYELSHKNLAEQEAYITQCMVMDRKNPFNESVPPLWRMRVFGIDETTTMVLFVFHHAILDGWSVAALMTELHNTYLHLHTDPHLIPPPLHATYKDAVIDEIAEKTKPAAIEYWKKELRDYNRLSFSDTLSGDYGHEKMKIFSKSLGTAVLKKLREAVSTYNTTINHLCFGAYIFIMSMLANENDILVGYVTNNRPVIPDGDKIVGCFLNTVPVRVKMPTGLTWAQYIRFIENKMLEIKEFERFSLFEIARVIGEKAKDRNPIFDTLFNFKDFHIFQEAHTGSESIETYNSVPLRVDRSEDTNTLLDFEVDITGNSLGLDIKYKSFAISNQRVTQCFTYFKQIIDQLINEPGTIIRKNDIISNQEKKQLLEEFNDTDAPYSHHKTMHQLFEEQVEKTPHQVSVIGTNGKQQLTYKELNHKANQLARTLRKRGVVPGYLAAVIMDRSPSMVTGVMGILKAGGAYVPLESYLPDERIRKIMESLKIRTLLTNAHLFLKVAKIARELPCLEYIICLDGEPQPGLEIEAVGEILPGKAHVIALQEMETQERENPAPCARSTDISYVIFTSGSTGTPKGVVETHRPVVNVIEWVNRTFAVAPPDKLLFVASLGFDLSVYDIFGILASGACLRVVSGEDIRSPQVLLDIIMKERITFWDSAPAALQQLVPFFPEVSGHSTQTRLRLVFLSGDWIPVTMPEVLRDTFAGVQVISLGGATEATIWSNYYPIDELDPSWPSIPYGKPIQNARYYILDQNLELCPLRVPGDLYIGGKCLATEYINDALLTANKFLDNPYAPGEKIYKTGDIARWFEDGNMQFLGRKDHQVKIRGFRVELGEIETQLLNHPLIGDVVVVDREDASGSKYLCAYYILKDPAAGVDKAALKEHLAGELPEYMIPAYFIPIDKIPLTANGKLDRKALPEPGAVVTVQSAYAAPGNEIQETLVEIWSQVLFGRNSAALDTPIGIDDDFFELGGHSLNATIAASKIHKELKVKIPLAEIFNSPTIRELSNKVGTHTQALYAAIDPMEKREYYPLSSAQRRLYFLQQMEWGNTSYNIQEAVILEGTADIFRLEEAFRKLIRRHESLRTSFEVVNDETVQYIHDDVLFEIEYYQGVSSPGQDFVRPFDLSLAPLLRVGIFQPGETSRVLIADMHHIISDGISHAILVQDFLALYTGSRLPFIRIHYKDYSQWQNSEKPRENMKIQEAYWLNRFEENSPVLNLPIDFPRPALQSFQGNSFDFEIDSQQTASLNQLALNHKATLFMVLLSIYNILLSKISNQEDIVLGTPIAGRNHAELDKVIGMFVNTLVLRNHTPGEASFKSFLKTVREKTLEAFENQDYLFEDLVEKVAVNRDASRNPLFDVVFVLQNIALESMKTTGTPQTDLSLKSYRYETKISKFDLTLTAVETGNIIRFTVEYCTRLFKEKTIQRIIGYFKKITAAVSQSPGIQLLEIDLLSEDEKKQVLVDFNRMEAGYPKDKVLHQLFEEQAAQTPDQIALIGAHESRFEGTRGLAPLSEPVSITYKELNKKSNQLAAVLREKGVKPDTIAAMLLEPAIEMITGTLGILKAGGAYLPIDPDYPPERINYMIADSNTKLLVTTPGLSGKIKKLLIVNCQLLIVNEELPGCPGINNPPKEANSVNNYQFTINNLQLEWNNLAYVIYTSGTTGRPKGMLIHHRNVVRLMKNDKFLFDFDSTDIWSLFHSYCFDFSVWEMYGALLYGGQLVIIPKMMARDTRKYLEVLKQKQVTVLNQTPSAFYHLSGEELKYPDQQLHIKYVIFGGEALNPAKLTAWKAKYPATKLINMFGITETTVHVTFKELNPQDMEMPMSNIGKPIPTLSTYIMDRHSRLLPVGTPGECCVGGEGVGRGYLNRPELTREKFMDNPYKSFEKIYRSGDLIRFLENGDMEYLGRIDQQVKIRGFRIELKEIENQLLKHEDIKEAVVTDRVNPNGDRYLYAYIIPRAEASPETLSVSGLRGYLAGKLPDYMVPSHFIRLEKIPLTPHGKIDRKLLDLQGIRVGPGTDYVVPQDEVEKQVAQIWQDILRLDKVGIYDNYFELGGTSFDIVRLTRRLKEIFNLDIPVVYLFRYPTVHLLANYLKNESREITGREAALKQGRIDKLQQLQRRRGITHD